MHRALVIFFFIAVIASPVYGWVSGLRTGTQEKRTLAPLPGLSLEGARGNAFYKGLERYYDDRFPFRGWVIKAKNWIDYRVFGASPSKNVHIGTDGYSSCPLTPKQRSNGPPSFSRGHTYFSSRS